MPNKINFSGFQYFSTKMLFPTWEDEPGGDKIVSLLESMTIGYRSIIPLSNGFIIEMEEKSIKPWISYEINRLIQKSIIQTISIHLRKQDRLSNSWNLITHYYLSFYLCQAFQRLFGSMVSNFPSKLTANPKELSNIKTIEAILGKPIDSGSFSVEIERDPGGFYKISCQPLGKGNTHYHNWKIFSKIINDITPQAGIGVIKDIKLIRSLYDLFSSRFHWTSDLRNSVNYQLTKGYLEFEKSYGLFYFHPLSTSINLQQSLELIDRISLVPPKDTSSVHEKATGLKNGLPPLLWYTFCLWGYQYHRTGPTVKFKKDMTKIINKVNSIFESQSFIDLILLESH